MEQTFSRASKGTRTAGWIISGLVIVFLLIDAVMKILLNHYSVEGSVKLGWPESGVQGIGAILLVATILYVIRKTAVIGAILLSAYLGGAVAIMIRAGAPAVFPIAFGLLVWTGLALRESKVKALLF